METLVTQLVSGRVGFRPRPCGMELILWTPSLDALPVASIIQPTRLRGVSPAWSLRGHRLTRLKWSSWKSGGGFRHTFLNV